MRIQRRAFTAQLLAAPLGLPLAARAQGQPLEGQHYVKLNQPVPVPSDGKVHVVEFFWYGCPHCNALEPTLEAWVQKLPPDVAFQRVPAVFNPLYEIHAKVFYALETMNLVEQMHRKVFAAIHLQRKRLDKEPEIEAFMTENGIDGKKFIDIYRSFAVQSKLRQARQLAEGYKIDGVPTLGVQGRYFTSVGMAGGQPQALQVVDFLAQKVRSGGR